MTIERKYHHGLKKFSDASFVATSVRWKKELSALRTEVLVNDYERLLVWAGTHIGYEAHGQSFFYGTFDDGAATADAIAEINYFKKGANNSWLKVLDLHLSPELKHLVDTDKMDYHKLSNIFIGTVAGTFALTHIAHPSKIVKYYARGDNLLQFFQALSHELNSRGKLKNVKTSIEGRWLVFRKP